MKRLSKNEVLALLAVAGVTGGTCVVNAAETTSNNILSPMGVVEHPSMSRLGGDAACGAGACGADDKGAAAAKKKHDKSKDAKSDKKSDKKPAGKSDKKADK